VTVKVKDRHKAISREWLLRWVSSWPIGTAPELRELGRKARQGLDEIIAESEAHGMELAAFICDGIAAEHGQKPAQLDQHASVGARWCAEGIRARFIPDPVQS